MCYAPHHRPIGQSLPPRGSLDVRKGFPFLLNFALSKMRQGEALEQGWAFFRIFALSKNKARGSREMAEHFCRFLR